MSEFSRGLVTIQDIIIPEAIEVDFTTKKLILFILYSLCGRLSPRGASQLACH